MFTGVLIVWNVQSISAKWKRDGSFVLTNVRETKTLLFGRELRTDQGTAIPLKITPIT